MKTKHLILLLFSVTNYHFSNAQVTTASNTVAATAYLGSGATSNFDVIFKRNNISAGLLSTTKTFFGVNSNAMPNSTSIGVSAGQFSSGTGNNTYIGNNAGKGQSASVLNSGIGNVFLGQDTGIINTSGFNNFFAGSSAGNSNTTGTKNVYLGTSAGNANNGSDNVFIGYSSSMFSTASKNVCIGSSTTSIGGIGNVCLGYGSSYDASLGDYNTFLGHFSGWQATGSRNIYIGNYAGNNVNDSDKLFIENSTNQTFNPLIWGDFALDRLKFNAKVGIGGNSTTGFSNFPTNAGNVNVSAYNLFVKGGILTEEVRISTSTTWADYVFNKDYKLKPLSEVEKFINKNGHLPNVPSAKQVKEEGIELGNMAKIQQEKIEELTLYIIEQNKQLEAQNKRIEKLESLLLNRK